MSTSEKRPLSEVGRFRGSTRGGVEQPLEHGGEIPPASSEVLDVIHLAGQALDLAALAARANAYAAASKADSTRRAYELDWREFSRWCEVRRRQALPADPDTVALYLTAEAGRLALATLRRRLATIAAAHQALGEANPCESPTVHLVLAGIMRKHGVQQVRKTPLVIDALKAALACCGDDLRGRRDRALLLLGFAGALRRSELVAVRCEDLAAHPKGLVLTIPRSKTDQVGAGRIIGIPHGTTPATSPPAAISAWRTLAGVQAGPLLRAVDRYGYVSAGQLSGRTVADVIKRVCLAAGLEGDYSGHSLRAGLATSAALAGAGHLAIAQQTGHRSAAMVQRYVRPVEIWEANAAALAGL
jgi:integrase